MLKVNEAREMLNELINQDIADRKQRVADFCDTQADEKIKEAINNRQHNVMIECDTDIREEVANYITNNGYVAIHRGMNKVEVRW